MQHSTHPQSRRAHARAAVVDATSHEVALLFPAIAGLSLLLLVL